MPIGLSDNTDYKRIAVGGGLQLGGLLAPGDYILQVVVTDQLRHDKRRTVTQWIDFEVVK